MKIFDDVAPSVSGSALDPHSMGSWIRIQKSKISPTKEEKLCRKTRKNMKISTIFYEVIF
jgi:hypothetical protein